MDPLGWPQPLLDARRGKLANAVGKWSSSVDECSSTHGEAPMGDSVLYLRRLEPAVLSFFKSHDACIVERLTAAFRQGLNERYVVPGVVELAVGVRDAPDQTFGLERGDPPD